ncbi:MAG TPA: glycoside hydrolase family 9 protein [Jatrophihabitans sp.]
MRAWVAGLAAALVVVSSAAPASARPTAPADLIRVDLDGYAAHAAKTAALMSTAARPHAAVLIRDAQDRTVATATVQRDGSWSTTYPDVYRLSFGGLHRPGRYRLVLAGTATHSPWFRVTTTGALWSPVLRAGVRFIQGQRDGRSVVRSVLQRRPSHLNDAHATVYRTPHFQRGSDVITDTGLTGVGGPVDVAGGWFDAGDYLKFTHTAAFADVLLYVAQRELGGSAPRTLLPEARHGTAWLAKMWRPRTKTLYLQVGIGSGNARATFYGDHDGWRLPQRDDGNRAREWRYVAHRPVFLAARPGRRISPNLAGRTAAAFALAAQVDAHRSAKRARHELYLAQSLYAMADTASPPHPLVSAAPFEYYPESTWADDMELGATEIALARHALRQRAPGYVADAARWAHRYLQSQTGDRFNLYDVSALAHADLAGLIGHRRLAVTRQALLADLRRQLDLARHYRDPFAAGVNDREFDVDSHTMGLVATQGWYARVSGDHSYDALAARLRGWVFGRNAWGTSFMVGIGSTFPHCMQHQVANLVGSTSGRPPVDLGAVVNGPNSAGLFSGGLGGYQDGMRACSVAGLRRFDGSGSRYLDDARSWQTDEPALDMTGTAIAAAAAQLTATPHR